MEEHRRRLLRQLPAVDELLQFWRQQPAAAGLPRSLLLTAIRQVLQAYRRELQQLPAAALPASLDREELQQRLARTLADLQRPRLRRVINASGVVIHTNLGRSPLGREVLEQLVEIGGHYSNLEYNLALGARGSRHDHLEGLLRELTGAEAAIVVNNNAGAVLLTLNTLARGREVIVSRGQLVEIGGSFRMPDVMRLSGAILKEVGTTNKTHLYDYENAITPETALLLKVHTSNYRILGFTKEVPLAELVALGRKHGLPVAEDLGSGCLIDLSRYGIEKEPTVAEVLGTGVDLVMFSGDKLLGGPQAGIVLGGKVYIDRLKRNPLTRALRPDKLTLAGLEATLRLYREEERAVALIPTLRLITMPAAQVQARARKLARRLRPFLSPQVEVTLQPCIARVGGGALPQVALPSWALVLVHRQHPAHRLEEALRQAEPPIIGRLEEDRLWLDVRTVLPEDEDIFLQVLAGTLGTLDQPA